MAFRRYRGAVREPRTFCVAPHLPVVRTPQLEVRVSHSIGVGMRLPVCFFGRLLVLRHRHLRGFPRIHPDVLRIGKVGRRAEPYQPRAAFAVGCAPLQVKRDRQTPFGFAVLAVIPVVVRLGIVGHEDCETLFVGVERHYLLLRLRQKGDGFSVRGRDDFNGGVRGKAEPECREG